jgi:hypothetical protein
MAVVIIALLASESGRVELGLRCLETKGLRPGQLQWSCGNFWSPSVQRGPGHSATCQGLLPAMMTEGSHPRHWTELRQLQVMVRGSYHGRPRELQEDSRPR